ncbi:hypothetical protein CHH83_25205 [Bacillus sp. 7586-K]|nr:hypothetical protein CHH83_25205 [Bacillus sp. 7586-K]
MPRQLNKLLYSAFDFYSQLVNFALNQKHKNDILHALEDKKVHLKQLPNLYVILTGRNKASYNVKKNRLFYEQVVLLRYK